MTEQQAVSLICELVIGKIKPEYEDEAKLWAALFCIKLYEAGFQVESFLTGNDHKKQVEKFGLDNT